MRVIRCAALLTLLALSLTPPAAAQADTTALPDSTTEDVIYFKSGATLRGRILDSETTKGGLLIRTRDGRDVRISHDQIARVVRGQRPATPVAAPAASVAAKEAPSQAPPGSREGFWMGLGSGWGSTGLTCDACTDQRFGGFAGYLNGGGTLGPGVQVGGEFAAWLNTDAGVDEHMTFLTVVGILHPEAQGGFYLKGGLGAMWYAGEVGTDEITATAPALVFGGGYQFRIGSDLGLDAYLTSFSTLNAGIKINGQSAGDAEIRLNLVQLGVGVSWRPRT